MQCCPQQEIQHEMSRKALPTLTQHTHVSNLSTPTTTSGGRASFRSNGSLLFSAPSNIWACEVFRPQWSVLDPIEIISARMSLQLKHSPDTHMRFGGVLELIYGVRCFRCQLSCVLLRGLSASYYLTSHSLFKCSLLAPEYSRVSSSQIQDIP